MLLESNLHKYLWTYSVMFTVYIRNRCFNARLGKTLYEVFTGRRPNVSSMYIFGSTCYAYVQDKKKLDARSQKGIFVGYDRDSPSYLVYFPESNVIKKVRCVRFTNIFETNKPEVSIDVISERYDYVIEPESVQNDESNNINYDDGVNVHDNESGNVSKEHIDVQNDENVNVNCDVHNQRDETNVYK